jgi:hypothetical protein
VEHFIRTGEANEKTVPPTTTIDGGAQIVLLDRILERALSEFRFGSRDRSTIPGWNPVSMSKSMIDGVETYFPLHDEHFNTVFLAKVGTRCWSAHFITVLKKGEAALKCVLKCTLKCIPLQHALRFCNTRSASALRARNVEVECRSGVRVAVASASASPSAECR